jgi:16S rRNA processing protein RimM|tara:strand:- start:49 stop:561 length:513 start_codon:yes stop_codon:yes gene_type:complete
MSGPSQKKILLGYISGLMGVKGWIKVHSYTHPRENITEFKHWILILGDVEHVMDVESGRKQGRTIVAKFCGINDPDEAKFFVGAKIFVCREDLSDCEPGEYYWADLEGLEVRTKEDELLGHVDSLIATGEHDVMVVVGERERMIPFVRDKVICEVDFSLGVIIVDWDSTY